MRKACVKLIYLQQAGEAFILIRRIPLLRLNARILRHVHALLHLLLFRGYWEADNAYCMNNAFSFLLSMTHNKATLGILYCLIAVMWP